AAWSAPPGAPATRPPSPPACSAGQPASLHARPDPRTKRTTPPGPPPPAGSNHANSAAQVAAGQTPSAHPCRPPLPPPNPRCVRALMVHISVGSPDRRASHPPRQPTQLPTTRITQGLTQQVTHHLTDEHIAADPLRGQPLSVHQHTHGLIPGPLLHGQRPAN